jgi:hypothetical protein
MSKECDKLKKILKMQKKQIANNNLTISNSDKLILDKNKKINNLSALDSEYNSNINAAVDLGIVIHKDCVLLASTLTSSDPDQDVQKLDFCIMKEENLINSYVKNPDN